MRVEMMYVRCTFICERFFDRVLFLGLAISYTCNTRLQPAAQIFGVYGPVYSHDVSVTKIRTAPDQSLLVLGNVA